MTQLTVAFRTAEAIDQWFENLQNYEATLVRKADCASLTPIESIY
jgi:hypothetical protein